MDKFKFLEVLGKDENEVDNEEQKMSDFEGNQRPDIDLEENYT